MPGCRQHTVYILLIHSGTWFSRLIHLVTDDCYTHASIGLDGPQGPFYSFARKHRHFALPAGLVEEQVRWEPSRGSRGAIPCRLYALPVPPETYRLLRRRLEDMYARREEYHYNLLGTLACCFNWPLPRRRHFFCSQFVARLLQECGAVELPKPADLVRPADFCRFEGLDAVALGPLSPVFAG